jgi:hypothetical protein
MEKRTRHSMDYRRYYSAYFFSRRLVIQNSFPMMS